MKKNQGNLYIIVIIIVVLIAGAFLFLKFLGPKFGINLLKSSGSGIQYVHADGFPKVINVNQQYNKARVIATSQDQLNQAIASVDKNHEIKIPTVNFNNKIALFVTSKTRDNAGYQTKIKKIYTDKGDLVVVIWDVSPGSTCVVTQQTTLPMDLVVLDKTALSVEFKVEIHTQECN